jgi:formylmethanofuran dehydrogenase subunit E
MMTPTAIAEVPLWEQSFDDLLTEAVSFHGHLCPGQVLGVRMTMAGCRDLGFESPRRAGKRLVVLVEIDRCATDAIQALTGVSLGKRTLKHLDYGKMAATFVDNVTGDAVRVVARDEARVHAAEWAPGELDPRRAQVAAYRVMPKSLLLRPLKPLAAGAPALAARRPERHRVLPRARHPAVESPAPRDDLPQTRRPREPQELPARSLHP